MADSNVIKSQTIDQCKKLISKIGKANGDICCANGGVLGVLRVLKQPDDTVLEEQTNLTIGAEMLCEQINRDYETVFDSTNELESLLKHALDQTGIDVPHDKQSNRTKQLENALSSVGTLLSSAHEALESIKGTLGSVEEDSVYQCALAMVQKAGVVADAVDGYSSRGEASAWFEPWVEEKTS